jgi:hypothetical protein
VLQEERFAKNENWGYIINEVLRVVYSGLILGAMTRSAESADRVFVVRNACRKRRASSRSR